MVTKVKMEEIEELADEFTADELREFLEADGLEVPFDPDFKEQLRQRLWDMMRARFSQRTPPGRS